MFPIRDHNPSTRTPYVTWGLITLNVVIFLFTLTLSEHPGLNELYYNYAMIPVRISGGENYLSLITSLFLHAGWMHLLGNMLFLWIFGDNLEDQMGHIPFLIFYLLAGAGADIAQVLADPNSGIPTIGASGAIAGVMGGYLLLFPKAKVDILLFFIIFFRIFTLPAWVMLGFWFAMQMFNSVATSAAESGVAYWAHAGGFIIGLVLTLPFWIKLGASRFWGQNHGQPPHAEAKYKRSSIPNVRRK